jgi:hypothetical protein
MLNYVALSKSLNEHGIWMSVAKCFQVFEVGNSSIVVKRLSLCNCQSMVFSVPLLPS